MLYKLPFLRLFRRWTAHCTRSAEHTVLFKKVLLRPLIPSDLQIRVTQTSNFLIKSFTRFAKVYSLLP